MGIKSIDHRVIVAADLLRTLDFYQRLGFSIAWEPRPGRPDMATIRMSIAETDDHVRHDVNDAASGASHES